ALAVLGMGYGSVLERTHNLGWVACAIGVWTIIAPWCVAGGANIFKSVLSNPIGRGAACLLRLAALGGGPLAHRRARPAGGGPLVRQSPQGRRAAPEFRGRPWCAGNATSVQPVPPGVEGGSRPVPRPGLGEDPVDVRLDGVGAQEELPGDLGVVPA